MGEGREMNLRQRLERLEERAAGGDQDEKAWVEQRRAKEAGFDEAQLIADLEAVAEERQEILERALARRNGETQ